MISATEHILIQIVCVSLQFFIWWLIAAEMFTHHGTPHIVRIHWFKIHLENEKKKKIYLSIWNDVNYFQLCIVLIRYNISYDRCVLWPPVFGIQISSHNNQAQTIFGCTKWAFQTFFTIYDRHVAVPLIHNKFGVVAIIFFFCFFVLFLSV